MYITFPSASALSPPTMLSSSDTLLLSAIRQSLSGGGDEPNTPSSSLLQMGVTLGALAASRPSRASLISWNQGQEAGLVWPSIPRGGNFRSCRHTNPHTGEAAASKTSISYFNKRQFHSTSECLSSTTHLNTLLIYCQHFWLLSAWGAAK